MTDFYQSLRDLIITEREKLETELQDELARAQRIANFTYSLKSRNDSSEQLIENTARRLGLLNDPPPLSLGDEFGEIAQRFAPTRAEQTAGSIMGQLNGHGTH